MCTEYNAKLTERFKSRMFAFKVVRDYKHKQYLHSCFQPECWEGGVEKTPRRVTQVLYSQPYNGQELGPGLYHNFAYRNDAETLAEQMNTRMAEFGRSERYKVVRVHFPHSSYYCAGWWEMWSVSGEEVIICAETILTTSCTIPKGEYNFAMGKADERRY